VLTPAQLREDLRVARGALEESHVGLYWFTSRQELDRRFERLYEACSRPMTAREFHRLLLPVVVSLHHGHTTLSQPAPGIGYRLRSLDQTGRFLPFALRVLNNRLFIVTDLRSDAGSLAGAEILRIDGRPVRALLEVMRGCVSAEGENDTFKTYQLGSGYQFHYLLDLLYGPSQDYRLEIAPLSKGSRAVRRVAVAARSPRKMVERFRERTGRDLDSFPNALRFELLGGGTALLTVSSFYEGLIKPGEPGFEPFLAATFKTVKASGIRDLIIDLRGNEGGNSTYPPLLYSYLTDKPFRIPGPTVMASPTMSFFKYADNPSDDIQAFAANPDPFVRRGANGSWVLKAPYAAEEDQLCLPKPDPYLGRLHVLTDGGSFSASNGFLGLVYRYHRRAGRSVRFVGEQNGGDNTFGLSSGGQVLPFVLPNSRQRLNIPLLGSPQLFGEGPPRAVLPDQRVQPSIRDVIAGVDRELAFVRQTLPR
jgi:hypothetical protein